MLQKSFLSWCLVFSFFVSQAQLISKKLPRNLTNNMDQEYAPYISAHGNRMLLMKPDLVTGDLFIFSSTLKNGAWTPPEDAGIINKSAQLFHKGGYALTPDGNKMFFTWKKHGGVGQFDIWTANFNGKTWDTARNIGMPVNSTEDEYCPTVSADGTMFMFLRATGVKLGTPHAGKLMVCEMIGDNTWTTPEVAKGFENRLVYAPRLLADGKTIVYTMQDKGGAWKFYKSEWKKNTWSIPISLGFLDDSGVEPHLSGSIHTDMLYASIPGTHSNDLFQVKIPDALKPMPVTFIEGTVQDEKTHKPVQSFVQVYDAEKWERLFVQKTDDKGNFNLILPAGVYYDIYIQESALKHTFYSERKDLRTLDKFSKQTLHAKVEKLYPGVGFILEGVDFKENSSKVVSYSFQELDRLESLLAANPSMNVEIVVFDKSYKEDTVHSSAELTELIVDTLVKKVEVIDTVMQDVEYSEALTPRFTLEKHIVEKKYVKKTYHNDRTVKQAEEVYAYLLGKGINKYRMSYKGYGSKVQSLMLKHPEVKQRDRGVLIIFQ